jgi:hypothetical protein
MGHSHRLHNGKRPCTSPISASFFVLIGAILVRKIAVAADPHTFTVPTTACTILIHLCTRCRVYCMLGVLLSRPFVSCLPSTVMALSFSLSYALPLVTVTCSPPLDSTIDLLQRLARYAPPRFRRTATPVSGHHRNQAARRSCITSTLA